AVSAKPTTRRASGAVGIRTVRSRTLWRGAVALELLHQPHEHAEEAFHVADAALELLLRRQAGNGCAALQRRDLAFEDAQALAQRFDLGRRFASLRGGRADEAAIGLAA